MVPRLKVKSLAHIFFVRLGAPGALVVNPIAADATRNSSDSDECLQGPQDEPSPLPACHKLVHRSKQQCWCNSAAVFKAKSWPGTAVTPTR